MNRSIQSLLAQERRRVDAEWEERITRYAETLLRKWDEFELAIDGAIGEDLPVEELAPIFHQFEQLVRIGVKFDPEFVLRMQFVKAAAVVANPDSEDEHDTDGDDDGDNDNDHTGGDAL